MIASHLSQISSLRMTPLRANQMRQCEAIVRINDTIVARLPGNRWWCSIRNFNNRILRTWRQSRLRRRCWQQSVHDLLLGLVALGMIEKKIVDEHLAVRKRDGELEDLDYHQKEIKRLARVYRFKAPTLKLPKGSK